MSIVDLIYPKMCVGCRKEGEYICIDCQRKLLKPIQICPMCCMASIDGWTHPRCKKIYGLQRLIIGLPYKGTVQNCMKKIKYRNAWDIIHFLYSLCEFSLISNSIVVSVPMWRDKQRERGFNQAEMLGRLVAEQNAALYLDVLVRMRETMPMYGLKIDERRENITDAFQINVEFLSKLNQKSVILVDDVWTTGSTMRECARVLKQAGAAEIIGLTLAW